MCILYLGNVLKDLNYLHPIYQDKILSFLPSSHATETIGTGLVHTAPAHGPEDYIVALENNISVVCFTILNSNIFIYLVLLLEMYGR